MSINIEHVGKAIAYLRKKAGYTQKELAEIIGISDKAVSKWERGISLPDITYITKLAAILDTDSDELLAGDVFHHGNSWEGLFISDSKDGVNLSTQIYGKPLVYHIIGLFLLAGVTNITIATDDKNSANQIDVLAETMKLNISVQYIKNDLHSINNVLISSKSSNLMIIYDIVFLYGLNLTRVFRKIMSQKSLPVFLSANYLSDDATPPIFFNDKREVVKTNSGDKVLTQYDYRELPIVFCAKKQFVFLYDENIKSINVNNYSNLIYTEPLDRGYFIMLCHTKDDALDLSSFVRVVEKNTKYQLYCMEEIAWRRGLITIDDLERMADDKSNMQDKQYLSEICTRARINSIH